MLGGLRGTTVPGLQLASTRPLVPVSDWINSPPSILYSKTDYVKRSPDRISNGKVVSSKIQHAMIYSIQKEWGKRKISMFSFHEFYLYLIIFTQNSISSFFSMRCMCAGACVQSLGNFIWYNFTFLVQRNNFIFIL